MIQSLSIQNFLSFKDEVTFSFEATKDKKLEDYQIVEVIPGVKLLKLGVVYGANASGKSNLLNAFSYLKHYWFNITESKTDNTGVIPFLLDKETPSQPSVFNLIFFVKGIKYSYYLEINGLSVLFERLDYYPGTQPAIIFERKLINNVSEIEFGGKIKISQVGKDQITIKCLPNMSVFAAYDQVNLNIPELEEVLGWMRFQFMDVIEPSMRLVEYAESVIFNDQQIKKDILAYLQEADFNISDTQLLDVKKEIPDFLIDSLVNNKDISSIEVERIKKEKTITVKEIGFSHEVTNTNGVKELYKLTKDLQSEGTMRIFGLSAAILQSLKRKAFLCIDEIESKLHPRLIEYVIERFLRESEQSQLLVATHYDGLLEEDDLLRKDNFWFTNKKEDGSTELYCLADFNAVNRITSLQKAYKYGKFGAIPEIE